MRSLRISVDNRGTSTNMYLDNAMRHELKVWYLEGTSCFSVGANVYHRDEHGTFDMESTKVYLSPSQAAEMHARLGKALEEYAADMLTEKVVCECCGGTDELNEDADGVVCVTCRLTHAEYWTTK